MAEKRVEENSDNLTLGLPENKIPADPQPEEKPGEEESEEVREPKRRKKCPSALEKFGDFQSSNRRSLSFSFDTKITSAGPSSTESTPKFGSFHLLEQDLGAFGAITTTSIIGEDDHEEISLGFPENNREEEQSKKEEEEEEEEEEDLEEVASEIEDSISVNCG